MAIDGARTRFGVPARRVWVMLGAVVLGGVAAAAAIPVPSDRTALVLRLGRPVRVINAWNAGAGGAGLALRMPLVDRVVLIDRRLMTLSLDNVAITTRDGSPVMVDAYAMWRVMDPVRFYQTLGTPDQAAAPMRAMFAAVLRQNLAKTPDRQALRAGLARELAGYGVAIDDIGLSRLALPDGAPLDAAYAQMAAHADADATAITAQADRDATMIRANAEARAAQIYAASFGKDPKFYEFYRAMQSYGATLAQKGGHTTVVLSPQNAWLRQFGGK